MVEIDEVMPFYICKKQADGKCVLNNSNDCFEECNHTTNPAFAKDHESVNIFEKFCDTFHVVVDDYGRLVCTEKEGQSG